MLRSNLSHIAASAPEAASRALLQTGADILDVAKQSVPVDTGALKQSGGVVPESSTRVIVGFGDDQAIQYAKYVEYGTSRSAAQPYLTPAFAQSKETFKARLKQEMEAIVNGR